MIRLNLIIIILWSFLGCAPTVNRSLTADQRANASTATNPIVGALSNLGHTFREMSNAEAQRHRDQLAAQAQEREIETMQRVLDAQRRTSAAMDRATEAYKRKDYAIALHEWRLLAQQGDVAVQANAQLSLGIMYANGEGVAKDDAEAVRLLRQAATERQAVRPFWQAIMDAERRGRRVTRDDVELERQYRQAVAEMQAVSQLWLGRMYAEGRGVTRDDAEAVRLWRQAAAQGVDHAQYELGTMYAEGRGVARDLVEAQGWYAKAAETFPPGAYRNAAVHLRDEVARQIAANQAPVSQPGSATSPAPVSTSTAPPPVAVSSPTEASPRRALVRHVQERLQTSGFNPGAIDGAMGPQTRDALRWFQNTKGILATGELDEKTLDALGVR